MAEITTLHVARIDPATVRISWTGTADTAHWVFLDGALVASGKESGVSKSAVVFWNMDAWHMPVVHEGSDVVTCHVHAPETRPRVWWTRVASADAYQVQYRVVGASEWTEGAFVPQGAGDILMVNLPDLAPSGLGYYDIRVRAVALTRAGPVYSTVSAFCFPVVGIPDSTITVEITESGGEYFATET